MLRLFRFRSPAVLRLLVPIIVLSVALFAPLGLWAQLAPESPLHTASQQELDIVKVLLKQEAAWNHGDIDSFAQGYKNSPNIIFVTRQVSRGYAGMVEEYKRDYPTKASMGTLTYSDIEVHTLDENYAVVIGQYHLDRSKKDGGNADGMFSLVFEKTDQGWKIIVDHTT